VGAGYSRKVQGLDLEFDQGSHVCHLFRDENQQKEVALRFLKGGLDRGECGALVVPDGLVDAWKFEMQAFGVDVVAARDACLLNIIPGSEWHQPGEFNSVLMARAVWRKIDRALARTPGVRFVADKSWVNETDLSSDQLCHWEASSNLLLQDVNVRAICQYDLARHSPANIRAGLRTHPIVMLDGRRLRNPYYEAPRILKHEPLLNASDADTATIEAMLSRLRNQTAVPTL
jgi:hypothetical protein